MSAKELSARRALIAGRRRGSRRLLCSRAAPTSTSTAATRLRSAPATPLRPTRSTQMVDPWPALQRQHEHAVQRPEDADRGRTLPHRPGDPAGHRHDVGRSPEAQRRRRQRSAGIAASRRPVAGGPATTAAGAMTADRQSAGVNVMRIGRSVTASAPGQSGGRHRRRRASRNRVRATFGASAQIGLDVVKGRLSRRRDRIDLGGATSLLSTSMPSDEARAARRSSGLCCGSATGRRSSPSRQRFRRRRRAPADADAGCRFSGQAGAAGRTGANLRPRRQAAGQRATPRKRRFSHSCPPSAAPASTTLAVQTAMLLFNSGARGKTATCLVDLDFQHGACADYLDIEPRLNLNEIEPRPERLDRQLLEVMLSQHPSGLAVVAAPNRPAEMRSFDPDVVTRLLDLVSSHFDYVVFDMPRTWFSWTDSVLLGSNKLFIVSETTVPGLRQAKQLVDAIRERLGDGPQPQVIINRFVQKMFSSGLAPQRHRTGHRRRLPGLHPERLRRWCVRRSIAAFRSTRSSPATRSRSSSKNWSCRMAAAKPARMPRRRRRN